MSIARLMTGILLLAIALAIVLAIGQASAALAVVLGVILVMSSLVAAIVYVFQRRIVNRWTMLTVMELAARSGMPPGPGLSAFASLCGGGMRHRAAALAYQLDGGTPLGRAIRRVPGVLPRSIGALVAVGSEHGDTAETLRQAEAAAFAQKSQWTRILPDLVYLAWILQGFVGVMGFCLYFIMPKLEAIYADFGMDLPGPTMAMIRVAHTLMTYASPALLIVLLGSLGIWLAVQAGWSDVPILGRILGPWDRASVLRALSVTAGADRPFEPVIDALGRTYPRAWMRRRLRRVGRGLGAGEPWTQALRQGRLLSGAEASLLDAAQAAGNLPWALETLAGSIERRLAYRLSLVSQVAFPLVTVAIGLVVFAWALAFFLPLVTLIRGLA
jgi:type II secretory pathway component PulF